jgi:glutaredoxin
MEFTVYSKYGCPYCDKIKFVLSQLSVNLTKYELDEHFNRQEFYEKFGVGATFPQVVFDNKNIGGCSDTIKYLQEQNMV